MKTIYKILICVVLLVCCIYGYHLYGKYQAKHAITDYMHKQGISESDIQSEYFYNNIKMGWTLDVQLKDDPDFDYEYIYVKKDKRIIFSVSKDDIFDDELTKDAKYKSLD